LNNVTHAQIQRRLDDYLDGALPPGQVDAVEAHLAECAECRAEVEQLRAIVEGAAALPQSIQPPRDLWPDIDARLDVVPLGERPLRSLRVPLAAAAVLLIAISSGVTAYLVGRDGAADAGVGPTAGGVERAALVSSWQATELEYLRATAELSEALDAVKGDLPAETVEMIERNLAIIDAAIQESRTALALAPDDPEMMGVLSARYREKIDVLRRVNRLAGS
jgi:hypothetical protein